MPNRFFRILSALIIVTVLLSACSGTDSASTEKLPLEVGWSLYPGYYPLVIAQELGYFEKYGVDVNLVFYANYKETTPPLASGLTDGATLVLGDALLEDIAEDIKIVLIADNSDGADQLIASPDIKTADDIRGKRIGVVAGTFGGLLVREMLATYGLSVADVKIVEVPPEGIPDAIPTSIDIGHTFEPFASQARAKGNQAIFTSADAPGLVVDVIAFRKSVVEERPDDIKNFINAWFDAVQYWQGNPEGGNAIIAKATGQDVKDVSFEGIRFFNRAENIAAFQPGANRNSVVYTAQLNMQYLVNIGLITKPADINEVLDASYLQ